MKSVVSAALTLVMSLAATPGARSDTGTYRIDLARYFPSAATEAQSRADAIASARAFATAPIPDNSAALLLWLQRYDALLESLERHDTYVYLRAEEDEGDTADAAADAALGSSEDLISNRVVEAAGQLGEAHILSMTGEASLRPYRYLLLSSLAQAVHRAAVTPALDAAAARYKALRKSSASIASRQDDYAALLVSIATARNGVARLRGFAGAADAAYFDRSIDPASVERILRAVRDSDADARYRSVAAKAPNIAIARPRIAIADGIAWILDAARPMGADYADAYASLLDPASERLELCTAPECDDTGFSVGFAGQTSGVYFGGFEGRLDSVRAIAHESGHAVHREFMSLHQPIAAYNRGPAFIFESFAIFNELLFLNHLYRSATTDAQRAYYLNDFLDDATFQVFGSAKETELESAIYRGVADGTIKTAADLNALTAKIFPENHLYWAADRLFFTDPLYDVNYLYAGLLALAYFTQFERDPAAFAPRYVALLENGFDDAPAALERRFLGIDLADEAGLVSNAATLIDARTAALRLYSVGR